MPVVRLANRAVIRVGGPEAETFLNNLITTELSSVADGTARPGALLSPQGKILFDFLLSRDGDGFRLDCPAGAADDFLRRLTLYKLRAKVELVRLDQPTVHVGWQIDAPGQGWLADSRFPAGTVWRAYDLEAAVADASAEDWSALRIAHGVGESGDDYALGDAFPHDVLLDQNAGVSFRKGCFVGQEVVSRMQHRGTARRRLLIARAEAPLPAPGTPVMAGSRSIGTLGSVIGRQGLALVRIDRAAEAMRDGVPIEAEGRTLELEIPAFADFRFPEAGES